MQQFVEATRRAVAEGNWYAALSLALTLPDIASKLERPHVKGSIRYSAWCDEYLTPKYTSHAADGQVRRVFMTGQDTYALRCAVLHQGIDQVTATEIENRVSAFRFIAPRPGMTIHENLINGRLQLQVDLFCLDICDSTDIWWWANGNREGIVSGVAELMQITPATDDLNL